VLAVFETVAEHQPIGVTELAQRLDADKSAIQRALATLAEDGWIRIAAGRPGRYETTARIHAVAQIASGSHGLRQRARPALEALRDETGESVVLSVPEAGRLIVLDVVESRQSLRSAPPIGLAVPARSATGRAILPYMSRPQQIDLLGGPPDAATLEDFVATVARGYSISEGEVVKGSTNFAAPIFETDGQPVAIVLVSAPTQRVVEADYEKLGAKVSATARSLSLGPAPRPTLAP
jgi:IclR family acetate operon transcriptional repressor